MPIDRRTGLISQSKKQGLVNPSPFDLRRILEECLVTEWEANVLAEGLPLDGNRLISRYVIQQDVSIPAIWVANAPDENKPDNEGCEIIVHPDPQIKDSGPRYQTKRWTFTIVDRSDDQTRINFVMEVLRLQFNRGLYYVPRIDSVEEDIMHHNGLILLDLVNHFTNLGSGRPPTDLIRA